MIILVRHTLVDGTICFDVDNITSLVSGEIS